ncbi:MAG: hypothetical protein AAF802_33095, partial [Planctomycetota bacterium]
MDRISANISRLLIPVALCICCTEQWLPASEPDVLKTANRTESLRALIRFLESEVEIAVTLRESDAASEAEVDTLQATLVLARHDLAVAQNDAEEAQRQCGQLIVVRKRQLGRQASLHQSGFGSEKNLCIAIRRLASAEYLRDQSKPEPADKQNRLSLIVLTCNKELAQVTRLHGDGAASTMELNSARHRATVAEYFKACREGHPRSVTEKLESALEQCRAELDQIRGLRKNGYASLSDVYFARVHLLNTEILLANAGKNGKIINDRLGELIQVHEEMLPKLGNARSDRILRYIIEDRLELDRRRRAEFLRTGKLIDDLSFA